MSMRTQSDVRPPRAWVCAYARVHG